MLTSPVVLSRGQERQKRSVHLLLGCPWGGYQWSLDQVSLEGPPRALSGDSHISCGRGELGEQKNNTEMWLYPIHFVCFIPL